MRPRRRHQDGSYRESSLNAPDIGTIIVHSLMPDRSDRIPMTHIRTRARTRAAALLTAMAVMSGGACIAGAQGVRDTVRLTLQSAVERALEVSPDLGEARAGQLYAEARSRQARASRYLSEFSGTSVLAAVPGVTNPNQVARSELYLDPAVRNDFSELRPFAQTEIELVQPLYTWGQLGGTIRAAASGVDVEAAAVHAVELNVALRTADLYYAAVLSEDLYRLTGRAGEVVGRALSEIERLLEDGDPEVDDADRYQVLITEQEFKRRSHEVSESRMTARTALRHQLKEDAVAIPAAEDASPSAV